MNEQMPKPEPPVPNEELNNEVEVPQVSNKNTLNSKKIMGIIGGILVLLLIVFGVVGAMAFFGKKTNDIVVENATKGKRFWEFGKSDNVDISGKNEKSVSGNCQSEYDKLLEINGFDFDKYCFSQDVRSGEYDPNAVPQKKKNLVLIFDASGSMAFKVEGKRKIDIAKEAAWKFIDQVAGEENFNLSIVVYGHRGSNRQSDKQLSCDGIEEMYYLGDVNAEIAKSKLNKFDATGWTPIAKSFEKAKEILSGKGNDENFILLVSDGKEMCNGDPVATIKRLKQEGLNVTADVIGFDVGGADEAQLKAIAEAGDGDYFSVSNAVDLENAFAKHKEMLNKANFKIGQTVTNLYDISYIVDDYNQCRVMLEKEKIAMMLDIHTRILAGKKCESNLDVTYRQRYQQIQQKIEQDYQAGKNKFEKNNIKNK